MPCYDKKLEASRSQLTELTQCVLGTAEMIDWFGEVHYDFVHESVSEDALRILWVVYDDLLIISAAIRCATTRAARIAGRMRAA